jgi:hypothetical protein
MTIRRAKFLLEDINNRIDAMNPASSAQTEERTEEQENALDLQKQKEQEKIMAKHLHRQTQRQNERTDEDKKRARNAERVLGREMYGRARQRVYGS